MRPVDGARRAYADQAKRRWYARRRCERYARYLQALAVGGRQAAPAGS